MTALSRSAITRGQGCVYFNAGASQVAMPSIGGITADMVPEEFVIRADASGEIDRRLKDVKGQIVWTPAGVLTQAFTDILYPAAFRNPVIGTSVFGSADVPVVVHSVAGKKVQFNACALTSMPQLVLSADKPCYGAATLTALRGNGLELTNAAAFYTLSTAAYSAPSLPSSSIKTMGWGAAWGDVLAAIRTESGWTLDFNTDLTPDAVDGYGTNDLLINGVGVIAKARPKNLDETLLDQLKVQNTGVSIGMSRRRGKDLVLSGTGCTITLYDCTLQKGPLTWRGVEVRNGEVAFVASRAETTGAYGALFAIAYS